MFRFAAWSLSLLLCVPFAVSAQDVVKATPLEGNWQVIELIEEGRLVPQAEIRTQLIKDALVTVRGPILSFTLPTTNVTRALPFVVDGSKSPATLDIAGAEKIGSQGIYQVDGKTLVVCLSLPKANARPAQFASTPASKTMLMTMVKSQGAPKVEPQPLPLPLLPPPPVAKTKDETYRPMLIGVWGHQNDDFIQYLTLNIDNSFSMERNWKGAFKQAFHDNIRSSGSWELRDGVVILRTTASTERNRIGQVSSYRIYSLTASDVSYIDQEGQLRKEWKVR
jgi:uncharacterized protein (TIGR03067 family)